MDQPNAQGILTNRTIDITIPSGSSLSILGEQVYANLKALEAKDLGGAKICYEVSADLNGIKHSSRIQAGKTLRFYSVDALGFGMYNLSEGQTSLAAKIANGDIQFISARVPK